MKTQGNLVGISLGAYASMVGDGGSFPGAELFGLVALRNAWTTRNALRKGARQSFSKTQTWRNLELGAGRGRLARYTAELGHRLQPEGDVSVTLLEPVVEQNPQLVEVLSQLESQGAIAQGILNHCTFGQFLDERETGRSTSQAQPSALYDLIVMVYSFAAMVVEPKRSDAGVSGRLLQSIIQLLDANGMAVILDRDIAPDAPNELTMSFKDAPKVLRLAVEVIRASVFFRISWREARALVHDLLRIQREPGWGTLESVHREAGCRGQQLGNLVRVLCQMGVGHKVVDFGSSWLLIIWKQGLQG